MNVFKPGQVVFVTKYALTAGIQQATVSERQHDIGDSTSVDWTGAANDTTLFYGGRNMFATIEEAQANVAKQCERKLKALARQTAAVQDILASGAIVLPVRK